MPSGVTRGWVSVLRAEYAQLKKAFSVVIPRKKGTNMPEVIVNMAAGRTDDQKKGMMLDITQALVKNLGVDAEVVTVQINEAPLTHKMKGGKTFLERKAAAK
jgi:4-oxalocrotonate tautomerase